MGFRFAYGNSHSENGWPMVDTDSCEWITVPGTDVRLQIQKGWPLVILRAFAADFNEFVEPLRDADSACWTATNSVSTSNHLSGTALDLNWDSHPFRVQDAGFDGRELPIVRELLDFYEGTVFWVTIGIRPRMPCTSRWATTPSTTRTQPTSSPGRSGQTAIPRSSAVTTRSPVILPRYWPVLRDCRCRGPLRSFPLCGTVFGLRSVRTRSVSLRGWRRLAPRTSTRAGRGTTTT